MAWKQRHAETLGATIPIRRTRIDMVVRFDNLNPAVSFSISANSIRIAVLHDGRSCDLRLFDSDPRLVAGGYVDDSLLPEYVVVHPDRHALWQCEIFDPFRRWFDGEFAMTTEWLSQGYERGGVPTNRGIHEHDFIPARINGRPNRRKPASGDIDRRLRD